MIMSDLDRALVAVYQAGGTYRIEAGTIAIDCSAVTEDIANSLAAIQRANPYTASTRLLFIERMRKWFLENLNSPKAEWSANERSWMKTASNLFGVLIVWERVPLTERDQEQRLADSSLRSAKPRSQVHGMSRLQFDSRQLSAAVASKSQGDYQQGSLSQIAVLT